MPTEDNSHTRRISRVRQIADWKGLNKVVRALDSDTQLSIKLGGLVNITKNLNGKRINNGQSLLNYGQYTFPADAGLVYVYFLTSNCVIGERYSVIAISISPQTYLFRPDIQVTTQNITNGFCGLVASQPGVFLSTVSGGYIMILPYRSGITNEDIKNIFPELRTYTRLP